MARAGSSRTEDGSVNANGRTDRPLVSRQRDSSRGDPISPQDLRKILPFEPATTSGRLGWVGLEAARFRATPPFELDEAALTHHMLALFARPPEELALRFEGVKRHIPPAAGSIILVPAGSPVRARSSGQKDELHIFLEPGVVRRVAAEAFELDPTRVSIPPLDGLQHPQLRTAMLAVNDELTAQAGGDRIAVESLSNLIAVHLIRNALGPRPPARRTDSALPQTKLHAVVEYIEERLDTDLTLAQMAAAAHLSAYHFARQFKAATGVPPHQYVVARRLERAQGLLRESDDLSLADVAATVGFSDQSQFSTHFKHLIGVTPRQFRKAARIA
jgi:AraC family transcriptional regulator